MENFPFHEFYASDKLTPKELEELKYSMTVYKHGYFPELYKELPAEMRKYAHDWASRIEHWVLKKYGYDISARAGAEQRIARVSEECIRRKNALFDMPEEYMGLYFPLMREVLLSPDQDEATQLDVLRHELVHSYSNQVSKVERYEDGYCMPRLRRMGYSAFTSSGKEMLFFFNEVITELLHLEILQEDSEGDILKVCSFDLAFHPYLFVFDALVATSATRLRASEGLIRDKFYAGYFDGSTGGLKVFDQTLKKGALKYLSQIGDRQVPTKDLLANLADSLDGEEVQRQISAYDAGEMVEVVGRIIQKSGIL